ncbi:MAG: CBS domain-containing protein [Propionibacteriales bacterium]|nr:CBS domain-containing protein [Propionibacteriales bacterium]
MIPTAVDPIAILASWPVTTLEHDATLQTAIAVLGAEELGALLVLRHDVPIGILSERDVITHLAQGIDPTHLLVGEAMSGELVTAATDTSIGEAARLMAAADIRHLPVTRDDEFVGMVSSRDVIAVLSGAHDAVHKHLGVTL